jgi:predicted GTPase
VLGAAGRDFHDFRTFFRSHPEFRVCCFTAHQIPFIAERTFPRELAGPGYDADIPIHPEERLPELIRQYGATFVFLSYSDLSHREVMHKASLAQAAGASFVLLGPAHTQLVSRRPVVSVTAVRTGAGKSPLSQAIARDLSTKGLRVGVLRHPMPYGDLARQAVQRFATPEDLDRHQCTVEEREEYTPYLELGLTVYAGVDYVAILELAERESDVILWDGGNNDTSFLKGGLRIVVADALRPGHEVDYYPGETNFRLADVLVVSKVDRARPEDLALVARHRAELNPGAVLIESDLTITLDDPSILRGRRVLVVDDGPTLTHGGMSHGAGWLAARDAGAAEIVDPRPFAVGTLREAFAAYPHIGPVLPALGYSEDQRSELRETLRRAAPDVVVDASPARLDRLFDLGIPIARVRYRFQQRSGPDLFEMVERHVRGAR